jgi:hypothetical protein
MEEIREKNIDETKQANKRSRAKKYKLHRKIKKDEGTVHI